MMQFKSTLSANPQAAGAIAEACAPLAAWSPDLLMVFITHHYGPEFDEAITTIRERVNARNLIGCTAQGIIGPDREIENAPAIALWAAKMPGVRVLPFLVDQEDVQERETIDAWHDLIGAPPDEKPSFVILPDPFTIDAESCLNYFDQAFPESRIVGGMASGATAPGQTRLFLNDQVLRQGLVGVSLSGPILIDAVVSQGCRPVGEPFVITKGEQNVIYELRGQPALEVLRGVFKDAKPEDQTLMQQGVHVGNVVDERRPSFGQGDFLIRNLMGVVGETGLAINALIRLGQTIQFHVRDSGSADQEMKHLLSDKIVQMAEPPSGGLLFSCNGRGARMFGKPNHDVGVVNEIARGCQVAGFFAAGEIGPIGGKSHVHGFTSSLILFRPA